MMFNNTDINYFIFFASHYRKHKYSITRVQRERKQGELKIPDTQNWHGLKRLKLVGERNEQDRKTFCYFNCDHDSPRGWLGTEIGSPRKGSWHQAWQEFKEDLDNAFRDMMWVLGYPAQGQGLVLMILVGPFNSAYSKIPWYLIKSN